MVKAQGRMIRKTINESDSFALLSPQAGVLFCLLIPHYNAHGKQNGNPYTVKGTVCPKIEYFTIPVISKCLQEISDKTDVKWFEIEGTNYIHAINFDNHQDLREDRMGPDTIPDCPEELRTTPGLLQDKSGYKIKVKEKVKGKSKEKDIPNYTDSFLTFWDKYCGPNKTPNAKPSCFYLWIELTEQDQAEAIGKLQAYIANASEPKYIAKPSRYLTEKLWQADFRSNKTTTPSGGTKPDLSKYDKFVGVTNVKLKTHSDPV